MLKNLSHGAAATVDLDAQVDAAGYEKVVAPDLARLHKPGGKWISLPLQIYSTNMLFLSKRAMDKAKAELAHPALLLTVL